ncbi:hypothetical protein EFK07_23335 [Pseudomonas putida]|uniref:Uncharacterized protein n=1 Tax=Pseudomonas putida TaxID=303 RepID=A0A3M8SRV6_PSEPU|nr:hypothetical protein EFK07_23335 [Pseudomonas putida]
MLARLAGNATHLKMMGANPLEKTATKSNIADGQRLGRGFGEVFTSFIAVPASSRVNPLLQGLRRFQAQCSTCRSGFTREEAGTGK